MTPDVNPALWWTIKEPIFQRENNLFLEESVRPDTAQDHHLFEIVTVVMDSHDPYVCIKIHDVESLVP